MGRKPAEIRIIDGVEHKKCTLCEQWKPLDEFYNGYARCKKCHYESSKSDVIKAHRKRTLELTICERCGKPKYINSGYVCSPCLQKNLKERDPKYHNRVMKRRVENLDDSYINITLGISNLKIPARNVPLQLIDIQKLIIYLGRLKIKAQQGVISWQHLEIKSAVSALNYLCQMEIELSTCPLYGTAYERNLRSSQGLN